MRYSSAAVLLFFSAFAYPANTANQVLTSESVKHRVSLIGAKQVVAEYYDKREWSVILNGIASGDDRWLDIYSALEPFADAGAGEDLGLAVFKALPKVPFKVIPLFLHDYSVQQICTFTFEASAPEEGVGAYLDQLEVSLRKARTEQEKDIALECRKGITQTRMVFKGHPLY